MKRVLLLMIAWLALAAAAQPEQKQNPAVPTVTYDRIWEAALPQDVTITVQSTGRATYVSRSPTRTPGTDDVSPLDPDYQLEFTMSGGTTEKVFQLAQQANFFNGDFDYRQHRVASTGKKTLTYADPARHSQTAYDFSTNKAVAELTQIFEGISTTVEHGRKLQFLRRFDKLGLEAELKGMEDLAKNHFLAEVQIIAPTLESIANDPSILNIARARAKRLLELVPASSRR